MEGISDRKPNGRFLRVKDLAKHRNCSEATIWRHARDGRLPRLIKIGGTTGLFESQLHQSDNEAIERSYK